LFAYRAIAVSIVGIMSKVHLFVYGTLKRGRPKNVLLTGQDYLGPARTQPYYRLFDQGTFPCLVDVSQGGVAVQGELWLVDEEALRRIDEWEDAPNLFVRRNIDLDKFQLPVAAYFYRGDVSGLKDCGQVWLPATAD
jgi:gamma-glutamylcyclotransferase (GGCT)/AIG2-like uncharacterized protein YtfP